jgi:2'-hydroxyisoflavone reductase
VRWVEEAELLQFNVVPWTGLPLWIPSSETAMAGLQQVDGSRAAEAGLVCRPLLNSLEDTLEWMVTEPGGFSGRFTHTLERTIEAQLTGVAVP